MNVLSDFEMEDSLELMVRQLAAPPDALPADE
jgi:hypothetical protein